VEPLFQRYERTLSREPLEVKTFAQAFIPVVASRPGVE